MALDMKELNLHLFLDRTYSGANANQSKIVKSIGNSFTSMIISDWPLYESRDTDATVVARVQGLHIQAGIISECWYNSLNIVFQHGRFEGSTLQVMGVVVEDGEWAIVGGTGQFTMAQGVIYKNRVEQRNDGDITELYIRAFYTPLHRQTDDIDDISAV